MGVTYTQHLQVRINAAPTKTFEEMVGTKTAIRVLNMGLSRKIEELVTSGQVTRKIRTYNIQQRS
jgi:hypothetical protein